MDKRASQFCGVVVPHHREGTSAANQKLDHWIPLDRRPFIDEIERTLALVAIVASVERQVLRLLPEPKERLPQGSIVVILNEPSC